MSWFENAACAGQPQSIFFDRYYDTAKLICSACTVKSECLDYALKHRIEFGMWGGLTPRQRGIRNPEAEYWTVTCKVCFNPFRWANTRGYDPPKCCSSTCRRVLQGRSVTATNRKKAEQKKAG